MTATSWKGDRRRFSNRARLISSIAAVSLVLAAIPAFADGGSIESPLPDVDTKPLTEIALAEADYEKLVEATRSAPSAATLDSAILNAYAEDVGGSVAEAIAALDFQTAMAPVVETTPISPGRISQHRTMGDPSMAPVGLHSVSEIEHEPLAVSSSCCCGGGGGRLLACACLD